MNTLHQYQYVAYREGKNKRPVVAQITEVVSELVCIIATSATPKRKALSINLLPLASPAKEVAESIEKKLKGIEKFVNRDLQIRNLQHLSNVMTNAIANVMEEECKQQVMERIEMEDFLHNYILEAQTKFSSLFEISHSHTTTEEPIHEHKREYYYFFKSGETRYTLTLRGMISRNKAELIIEIQELGKRGLVAETLSLHDKEANLQIVDEQIQQLFHALYYPKELFG